MSTRIYLPSTGAAAVTPTNWLIAPHANNYTYAGVLSKISSDFANRTAIMGTSSAFANSVVRYVFGPIAAGNVSGTVEAVVRCSENAATGNATLNLGVHIIQPDGSNRATLLASTHSDSATANYEFTTTLSTRRAYTTSETRPPALTEQAASAGDYLVIELGFYKVSGTANRSATLNVGDNNANDCPNADADANAFAPWVEFSQNILKYYAPITANEGSYALTGIPANLTHDFPISANAATYTVEGTGSILGYVINANATTYAVAGADATLTKLNFYSLSVDAGTYASTGSAVAIGRSFPIAAEAGTYASAGSAVEVKPGFRVQAGAGSHATAGTAVELKPGFRVNADVGTHTTAGTDATLTFLNAYRLSVDAGVYASTGQAIALTLVTTAGIAADAGAYIASGQPISLSHSMPADIGTYALAGPEITLTKTAGSTYTLTVENAAYTVSGTEAESIEDKVLETSVGSHAVTGIAATLTKTTIFTIAADAGTYATSGTSATLTKVGQISLSVDAGAYGLSGAAVQELYARIFAASGTTFGITGSSDDLLHKRLIEIGPGSHALTASDVNLGYGAVKTIAAAAGTYGTTGSTADTLTARRIDTESGIHTTTGNANNLLSHKLIEMGTGAYTKSGSEIMIYWAASGEFIVSSDSGDYAVTGADLDFLKTSFLRIEPGRYTSMGSGVNTINYPIIIRVHNRHLVREIEKRVRMARVDRGATMHEIEKRR